MIPIESFAELIAAAIENRASIGIAGADRKMIGVLTYACGAETLREVMIVLRRSDPAIDFALMFLPAQPPPAST